MQKDALLLKACRSGAFGAIHTRGGAQILDAGFVYLDGEADGEAFALLAEKWQYRMFIPLSASWERMLRAQGLPSLTRTVLQLAPEEVDEARLSGFLNVPQGYTLRPFDREAYDAHPFYHGLHYPSYEDFAERGSGAVAVRDGCIAASASGFLTFENELELDVSTLPGHRRRGLGLACCAAMLLDCRARGFTVHWDAQNAASRSLAEKLGYRAAYDYTAFGFILPEEP